MRTRSLITSLIAMTAFGFIQAAHAEKPKKPFLIPVTPVIKPKPTMVAIIDTGIDTGNPSLKNYLWTNPGEDGLDGKGKSKQNNGIDDDKNGFVDDVHGWNFADASGVIEDDHGHGTHIAGIVVGDHGAGRPPVQLMVLKYFSNKLTAKNSVDTALLAIRYAVQMGADVINFSAGGPAPSDAEKAAINEALSKNILFIAAAGNESHDVSKVPFYPASYGLPNIISVTAVDSHSNVLVSSNFGGRVDLAAPGENIESDLPHNRRGTLTGTSQATAFVTQAAAWMRAQFPNLKRPEEIKKRLMVTAANLQSLRDKTKFASQVDVKSSRMISDRGEGFAGAIETNLNPMLDKLFVSDWN